MRTVEPGDIFRNIFSRDWIIVIVDCKTCWYKSPSVTGNRFIFYHFGEQDYRTLSTSEYWEKLNDTPTVCKTPSR